MSTQTHGHACRNKHSSTYKVWAGIRKRCLSPTSHAYQYYGGRGIKLCERWMVFQNFLDDMGERPEGMTIDRIDSDGDYCPENCRWISLSAQMDNRRCVRKITAFGITDTATGWAARTGLPRNTIYLRIKRGASGEEAVSRGYYSREHQSPESRSRKPKTVQAP